MDTYECKLPEAGNRPWKDICKEGLQLCAREMYAEKLRAAGFVSYGEEDLSWYRLVEDDVLQTVCFYSSGYIYNTQLSVGYGVYSPIWPAPIPYKMRYGNDALFFAGLIDTTLDLQRKALAAHGSFHVRPYKNTVTTFLDNDGPRELEEFIFPIFDSIHSIADAYQHHLNLSDWKCYYAMKVDEAIYLQDITQCGIYAESYERAIRSFCYEQASAARKKEFEDNKFKLAALRGERYDEYVQMLEKRRKRFRRKLEQKLGI